MKTSVLTLLLALGLAGAHASTLTPEHHAASQSLFAVPADQSRIVILRAEGGDTVIGTEVKIDGVSVGWPVGKSVLFKDVEPGKHTVSASAQRTVTIEVDAKPGQIVYVQQRQTFGRLQRHAKLAQLGAAEGQREAWGRD